MAHISWFLLSTAASNVSRHKGRSLLTVLSIIIGIATVIATLGIGRGAQEKIRRRLADLGTNSLILYPGSMGPRISGVKTPPLTDRDTLFLKSFDSRILKVAGTLRTKNTDIAFQNKKISAPLAGTEPDALAISKRTMLAGRNFVSADLECSAHYAILGSSAAKNLFANADPISKPISIDGRPFTVIGVLAPKENDSSFYDANLEVFLPLTTCRRLIDKHFARSLTVHSIVISVDETADIAQVERLVKRAMRARHQLAAEDKDDFTIWNQSSMMQAAEQSSQTFNLFLLIVASLSLLVGGLGVSNIMLVTVTERTKEIGIRMALGASPAIILWQFLFESVLLCVLGGLIGTLLGLTTPFFLRFFTDWEVVISPLSILLSVGTTTLIGLVFGFWPARRAAHLTIVDALNEQ